MDRDLAEGDELGRIVFDGFAIPNGPHDSLMLECYVGGINKAIRALLLKERREALEAAAVLAERGSFGPQGYEQLAIASAIRTLADKETK